MLATLFQQCHANMLEIIWTLIHFNDNKASPENKTKMYEVCPVLDNVVSKFHEVYQLNTNICTEMDMLLLHGHLAFWV